MVMRLKKKSLYIILMLGVLMIGIIGREKVLAEVAGEDSRTELRLIFTTDLHGQLNSTDYETGGKISVGGLARASHLIQQARSEVSNSLTFDLGDVLYDYTTEYFYSEHPTMVQPMYEAMSKIGYDAITLGNHEFDYDYDYLRTQLTKSGLMDKVIVSNLTESKSGKHPFLKNMLLTRTLTTKQDSEIEVKIGVIGETLPVLSSKGQDFTGVLKVQDIVENVTEQANLLKQQGADIVIVLSHSGMGEENPEYQAQNVSYALTKIGAVDVVMCGHEHNEFPTADKTGAYYKPSGINKLTDLANGKNLVMVPDRGKGIGIIDLVLENKDGKIGIVNRASEIRKATSQAAEEDKTIASLYDDWSSILLEYTKKIIGTVDVQYPIENFNGLIEDNSAIQLLNDAKRAYAMNYIANNAPEYQGYPVIAASTYISYGSNGYSDYVNISGELTESDLASMQNYNGYTALYKMTGKQLKEWLEWSASAYVQAETRQNWSGSDMATYMKSYGLNSLIDQAWLDNWSNFYVFDGVEYTINTEVAPRYDKTGKKISDSTRIINLTCNGVIVKDNQEFVLAVGKLAKTSEANQEIRKQYIYKGYVRTQGIISDYIVQKSKIGKLKIQPDYNWRVQVPFGTQFLVKTSKLAKNQVLNADWFVRELGSKGDYIYSVGSFSNRKNKNQMSLCVSQTYTDVTSDKIKVAVQATSGIGITQVRYKMGDYDKDSEVWFMADQVVDGYFYVKANDIYTVWAKDIQGNTIVEKVKIDNICTNLLKKPTVATYTNRKTKITGTAQPGTEIVIETEDRTYKTFVDSKGAYSYALPAQPSGTVISLHAVSEKDKRISESVTVKVKRTGPNQPIVDDITNNNSAITGNLNDDDASLVAIIGNKVYVGDEETKEAFLQCEELYKETYEIVETTARIDRNGEFILLVPVQKIDTTVNVYTIDHLYRKSMVNQQKVIDAAPNPPEVFQVLASDTKIEGYITSSQKTVEATVYIKVKNQSYITNTDESGYFMVEVPSNLLVAGEVVQVYAKDTKKNVQRISYITSLFIQDPEDVITESSDLMFTYCIAGDSTIQGTGDSYDEIVITVKKDGKYTTFETTIDENGFFSFELNEKLRGTEVIYAYSRSAMGDIVDLIKTQPTMKKPKKPVVAHAITNSTTKISVDSNLEGTLVIQVGNKKYETSDCTYDMVKEAYVFEQEISRAKSGTNIVIYCKNVAGSSSKYTSTVQWVVPEKLCVNKIYDTTKTIKGTIDGDSFTTVYAKIGNKVYYTSSTDLGNFSIKIPKQKVGTKITLWGENENGKGFSTTVKVTKK